MHEIRWSFRENLQHASDNLGTWNKYIAELSKGFKSCFILDIEYEDYQGSRYLSDGPSTVVVLACLPKGFGLNI